MTTGGDTKSVTAGDSHNMVMKNDGSVWVTGNNVHGHLGDGSTTDRHNFAQVKSSNVMVVAAGRYHSMVLMQDGSVWATGWNLYGQLGDGSITSTSDFIRVVKLNRVVVQDFVTVTGNVSTATTKEAVTTLDGWLPPECFFTTTASTTTTYVTTTTRDWLRTDLTVSISAANTGDRHTTVVYVGSRSPVANFLLYLFLRV